MKTNRVFLVGCPRSGTTLLQSMVATHPQVVSFPETHFFSETLSINPILRRLQLYGSGSREIVSDFLDQHGYAALQPFKNTPSLCSHNRWCRILLDILDEMIVAKSKDVEENTVWGLEKTPRHLFYISSIQQKGYHNKFLHILRNGPDVVASLYLATQQYPEQWGGSRSIKKCINWWNDSIKESLKYTGKSDHLFVTYEQLLANPKTVLQGICHFLELEYYKAMAEDFHNTAGKLTKEEEKWKQKNTQQSLNKSDKLQQSFDESTIAHIKEKVIDLDLEQFYL